MYAAGRSCQESRATAVARGDRAGGYGTSRDFHYEYGGGLRDYVELLQSEPDSLRSPASYVRLGLNLAAIGDCGKLLWFAPRARR